VELFFLTLVMRKNKKLEFYIYIYFFWPETFLSFLSFSLIFERTGLVEKMLHCHMYSGA